VELIQIHLPNQLNVLNKQGVKFINPNLNPTIANYVFDSIPLLMKKTAVGGSGGDTLEEIRQNTLAL